jgi:hypothetical protein
MYAGSQDCGRLTSKHDQDMKRAKFCTSLKKTPLLIEKFRFPELWGAVQYIDNKVNCRPMSVFCTYLRDKEILYKKLVTH